MVERLLVCGLALLAALPASAGERATYRPAVDALSLLMQDERAIFAPPASPILALPQLRSFDMREAGAPIRIVVPPSSRNLDAFDMLDVSEVAAVPARLWAPEAPSPFSLSAIPGWQRALAPEVTTSNPGRYAVYENMAFGRFNRRPRALDATLVLHLDGQEESPPISVGGGVAAALWQALPKP